MRQLTNGERSVRVPENPKWMFMNSFAAQKIGMKERYSNLIASMFCVRDMKI